MATRDYTANYTNKDANFKRTVLEIMGNQGREQGFYALILAGIARQVERLWREGLSIEEVVSKLMSPFTRSDALRGVKPTVTALYCGYERGLTDEERGNRRTTVCWPGVS